MKPKTLEKLNERYVGKACTIFTTPVNRHFNEQQAREHFVIEIEEINLDGVWGFHPFYGNSSFYPWSHIVGIYEEIVLDPNNPDHLKLIEEFQKKTGKEVLSDVSPHLTPPMSNTVSIQSVETPSSDPILEEPDDGKITFVDIQKLARLAKKTKKDYEMKKQHEDD